MRVGGRAATYCRGWRSFQWWVISRRLGLRDRHRRRRGLVGVRLAGERRTLDVIGGWRGHRVTWRSGWGGRSRRRWREGAGGSGRRRFGRDAAGRRVLVQFLCQSHRGRRRSPSKARFGRHGRGLSERLSGGAAVVGLSVRSGLELFRPGGRRRSVPHLRRWKEGEGRFGSSWGRSGRPGCWCC